MSQPPPNPPPAGFPFTPQDALEFMQKMWNPFGMPRPGFGLPGAAAQAGAAAGGGPAPGGMPFPNPAAMFATLVSLGWIVRQQWAENERLPFPLAQIEYSLIEAPQPGRSLNPLFSSRAFWIAALIVFAILVAMTIRRGATDPVCGMKVDKSKGVTLETDSGTVYFCSEHCRHQFEAEPQEYSSD